MRIRSGMSLNQFLTEFAKAGEPEVDATGLTRMKELCKIPLNAELLDVGTAKTVDDMSLQRRILKGTHHHD